GHILLACDLVTDNSASDRTSGVEAVERLPVAGIDREEVVVEIAREQHAARRNSDAGNQRRWPLLAPAHRARRRVDRLQPALRLIARIRRDGAAIIVRVLGELR